MVSAGLVRETDSDEDSHEGGHTEGYGGENNGDQAGDGTGETAAIAQNAPAPNIKDGQDAVDAPSDANNASNQAGDEENQ